MKKYAMYFPLGLMLLIPVCWLLAAAVGYQWTWKLPWVFEAVSALLFCASVYAVPKHAMPAPLAGLCLLLSMVNLFIILLIAGRADDLAAIALSLVCAAAAVVLLIRAKPHKGWKAASSVAAGLLFALYVCLLPITAFAAVIGYTEVVDTVYSPNGRHRAELLDINEGALGGDTVVLVYDERGSLDLGFCTLQKKPKIAYMGPWGEFKDMELKWDSDACLRINGKDYWLKGK